MKKFSVTIVDSKRDCLTFRDVVICAHDKNEAREIAKKLSPISQVSCVVPIIGRDDYESTLAGLINRQRAKGLNKYGQTLEDNTTLTNEQRIEHAQEEMVDALQYLEHLKKTQADRLTANDFQRAAMRTASGMDHEGYNGRGLLLNAVMGLNGEAGEVIDHVKKVCFQGHELDRAHLVEELGDVAWYLAVCAEALGVTLEEVLQRNIDKLKSRYPEGFDKARSINRKEAADNERTD